MTLEEEYFTVNEVASRFKVTRKAVYDWMKSGRLRYILVGDSRRIPKSAIDEFVKPGTPEGSEEGDQKNVEPLLAA